MKIVELTVSKSQKVNTGNYTSKDYFASIKAEIDCDDTIMERANTLYDFCESIIRVEIDNDTEGLV